MSNNADMDIRSQTNKQTGRHNLYTRHSFLVWTEPLNNMRCACYNTVFGYLPVFSICVYVNVFLYAQCKEQLEQLQLPLVAECANYSHVSGTCKL
jgi:hypothetical protein